jgi:hypothetical protein
MRDGSASLDLGLHSLITHLAIEFDRSKGETITSPPGIALSVLTGRGNNRELAGQGGPASGL